MMQGDCFILRISSGNEMAQTIYALRLRIDFRRRNYNIVSNVEITFDLIWLDSGNQ